MCGGLEGVGPRDRSGGKRFADDGRDSVNPTGSRQDGSQLENAAQRTVVLTIIVGRATRRDAQAGVRGDQRAARLALGPVMMQRPRGADQEVDGQRGDGNQRAAQEGNHRTVTQPLRPCRSATPGETL
jgi:hypothetical protein